MMLKRSVLLLCCMAVYVAGKTQDSTTSGPMALIAVDNAKALYQEASQKESPLYNGIIHPGYSIRIKGHAYFQDLAANKGSIVYDGLLFTNVPMWYDLLKDQVIIFHYNQITRLGLVSEKVKEFTLLQHHFIRIAVDSGSHSPLHTGFYDELYTGNLNVLAKHAKFINQVVKEELEENFEQMDFYYIQKNNTWYAVKSYKGLLTILKDKAKDIKRYLRKNKIKYRKDTENAVVKAVAFYDSLNK